MGALTSKPYAFRARPWELRTYETHDFLDAFCSAIRIDTRSNQLMRILPRPDFKLQTEWINDRTRFFVDGLKRQRLATPLFKTYGFWDPISWRFAFDVFGYHFASNYSLIDGLAGRNLSFPVLETFKSFVTQMGSSNLISDSNILTNDNLFQPALYQFPDLIIESQAIILINTNLRVDYPLLYARLRKLEKLVPIFSFGSAKSSFIQNLGSISDFYKLIEGKHKSIKLFTHYSHITFFFGELNDINLKANASLINTFLDNLTKLNTTSTLYYLPKSFSNISASYLNYKNKIKFRSWPRTILYLLDSDSFIPQDGYYDLIIYHGSHGDNGAAFANLILPASTLFETKDSYSYSLDGSFVDYKFSYTAPIEANSFQQTLLLLHDYFELKPKTNLKPYYRLFTKNPVMESFLSAYLLKTKSSTQMLHNFFLTDSITRASPTLSLASSRFENAYEVRNNFKDN